MLKSDDIKVGKRIRCVEPGNYFGLVGNITYVDFDGYGNKYWEVYDDNGDIIGVVWSLLECFELVTEPKIKSRSLTIPDMKVGTKVVCVYPGFQGQVGFISLIDWDYGSYGYVVQDVNGEYIGNANGWADIGSFNLVIEDEPDQTPKKAKTVLPPVVEDVVEVTYQNDKPCPSYYYGARACTCGKCDIHKKSFR